MYDYFCNDCENVQEEFHSMSFEGKIECTACKSQNTSKMISGQVGVKFNGSGFYCNDYGKKNENTDSK
jgi:putative FmdB family regulatory protein